MKRFVTVFAAAVLCSVFLPAAAGSAEAADPKAMRVVGNFSTNYKHVELEKPFFVDLPQSAGLEFRTSYNTMDAVNVKAEDALRLLRSGTFDVMSVQIGMAARDDPFLEGIDLVGVSTNLKDLRTAVDAYREALDTRLQKRFNVKILTLWPFGPQVFFSNKPIKGVEDFKGLKIRSFTPSMAKLIEYFGAIPVTLSFSEVYPALQRGVVDCGVTSAASGNTGKWPEVTTHLFPLVVSGSVQGHFINLDYWNKFSPESQEKLMKEFQRLEALMWEFTEKANSFAVNCNVGQEPCQDNTKFNMTLVPVSDRDKELLNAAVTETVLPLWAESCRKVYPEGVEIWNETVGKARGFRIQ